MKIRVNRLPATLVLYHGEGNHALYCKYNTGTSYHTTHVEFPLVEGEHFVERQTESGWEAVTFEELKKECPICKKSTTA